MPSQSEKRCLILGCSRSKRDEPSLLPAVERYDGPPFRVLRRFLREAPNKSDLDVYVLSAKYGLIPSHTQIGTYDERMSRERAAELRPAVLESVCQTLVPESYGELFLSMGQTYLEALQGMEELFEDTTCVLVSDAPSGKKLTELKAWLWGRTFHNAKKHEPTDVEPREAAQSVTLRGRTIEMTTAEAIARLEEAVEEKSQAAHMIRTWYVDVNNDAVSPKWAAQMLFEVPVNRFSADEARRVLRQLGLNCRRLNG